MAENVEKERSLIVTIWLWLSILANVGGLLYFIFWEWELPAILILFMIFTIISNILVLRWSIVGFFLNLSLLTYSFHLVNSYF